MPAMLPDYGTTLSACVWRPPFTLPITASASLDLSPTLSITRNGPVCTVTATTSLTSPTFYWYRDGLLVAVTTVPTYSLMPAAGERVRIECLASNNSAFDPTPYAPTRRSARRRLWWIRSLATDVDHYRVEQQVAGGDWTAIRRVVAEPGRWDYECETPRLTDLTNHAWRVVPVDRFGNDGTATSLGAAMVVRPPDAPDFDAAFDDGTAKITVSAG